MFWGFFSLNKTGHTSAHGEPAYHQQRRFRLLIGDLSQSHTELESQAPVRVVPEKPQTALERHRSLYIRSDLILTILSSLCFHYPSQAVYCVFASENIWL